MTLRSRVGTILAAFGSIVIAYAAYNFDNLLFSGNMAGFTALPVYVPVVITPLLWGLLTILDGVIIRNVSNIFSAVLYGTANFAWYFAQSGLEEELSVPSFYAPQYQLPFELFELAAVLLIGGMLVNRWLNKRQ